MSKPEDKTAVQSPPAKPLQPAPKAGESLTAADKVDVHEQTANQQAEDLVPPALTDEELKRLPQYVQDAAKRTGSVPRSAPKGGEGALLPVDEAYARQDALSAESQRKPIPAAEEFRAAPTAPGARPERDKWSGKRPSFDDVAALGTVVRVRTVDPNSAGLYVGGVRVTPEAQDVEMDIVRLRSDAHVQALLGDPRIEVQAASTGDSKAK